jgi:23S rRNA U2552 (ribose-2'-O)-methylase RlmE/FtsJ
MVKKFILVIGPDHKSDSSDSSCSESIEQLLSINKTLSSSITRQKNKITEYHNNKLWEKYKKIVNEYELIFTTPNTWSNVSNYVPVSRSFFKLWEILMDFNDVIFKAATTKTPQRCLFLAEGPGGFAEACIKFRNSKDDIYSGISLLPYGPNDKGVPDWKLQKDFMRRINISFGEDGTGNLYNYSNIAHLRAIRGANSQHLITADGGFDFSADFNNQEDTCFRLLVCEVLTALLLQRTGGTFVLKVFDMFNDHTLKLVHIIKQFYGAVYITKPLTSRPANSEKYLVCTEFIGITQQNHMLLKELKKLVRKYSPKTLEQFMKTIDFEIGILRSIIAYNVHYTLRQVFYIQRTISYINNKKSEGEMTQVIEEHIRKSKKWCQKYAPP